MSFTLENAWVFIPRRPGSVTFNMSHLSLEEPSFMMASGLAYIFSNTEQLHIQQLLNKTGASRGVVKDYLRPFHPDSGVPDVTHYLSIAMLARGYKSGALLPYHQPKSLRATTDAMKNIRGELNSMANQVIYSATYLIDLTIPTTKKISIYERPDIKGETI